MSDFRVTTKLADAGLLREISVLSDHDLVGSDATATSMGLAPTYTVNLLLSCAVNARRLEYYILPATTRLRFLA